MSDFRHIEHMAYHAVERDHKQRESVSIRKARLDLEEKEKNSGLSDDERQRLNILRQWEYEENASGLGGMAGWIVGAGIAAAAGLSVAAAGLPIFIGTVVGAGIGKAIAEKKK